MSYQVLARKWRPRSFREMVGQTHVLKALINALDNQRLHHAYLFTGTRGVGKTTIARIIAKCLNCETGVSSTPCGQCSVCREIDEGRFVDLIEVDAASRTKVEDTRELLDNVQYAPTRGRYKVYLIDEVHMLSTHSFNALLKTLEEPPPHVKFLLATTDPQKLPVTILSRCLQFALKNMPPERVVEHLSHVLGVEGIPFEQDALWLLGRAADGSMRDAMSLTDQAIAFGEGKVLAADVRTMLGTLDHGQVYEVLQALLEGDAREMLEVVQRLAEQGPDWAGVLAEMLNVLHRIAIAQLLPDAVDNGQGDRERVLALAQALPAEDIQFYYQMGLIGRRDLPLAPDSRSGFEMVLLRMLAFRPADAPGAPKTSLKHLRISPATTDSLIGPVAAAAMQPQTASGSDSTGQSHPVPRGASEKVQEIPAAPANEAIVASDPLPNVEKVDVPWDEPPTIAIVTANEEWVAPPFDGALLEPVACAEPVERLDDEEPQLTDEDYFEVATQAEACLEYFNAEPEVRPELPQLAAQPAVGLAAEWIALLPKLGLSGLTASIAANCTLVSVQEDCWLLHLDPEQSSLFNATQQRRLVEALNQYHGRPLKMDIQLCKPQQETPAQAAARRRQERQRAAELSIRSDPLVQELMAQFSATIRDGTIEPLEHSDPRGDIS
ncbi:DNA polymerase III subunit gamma/tau [Azomonas macrocytogenes]|uniref:DNA polymerase III subunit gamma/tau n=1 Tax=Azomonas macrocytogenes TaxID=69962 RepID=A0A839T254_AZOMA|nr:DNA polymerase III subunit gamma/tau [Azomonas macrocytogenes]MBB3103637.1 DNA polymerase-3 subunit gamma/tau [Azomonas macrocytogenes]